MHILEEIRDFFNRHKSEIARTTADADRTLQESLQNIKDSTSENVDELHSRFVEQSEQFKTILRQEKESFEEFMTQMKAQFSAQISHMPQMAKQLEEISAIPVRLDKLIDKVEKSNSKLASDISFALKQNLQSAKVNAQFGNAIEGQTLSGTSLPNWVTWTGLSALIIIAIACVFNVVIFFLPKENTQSARPTYIESVQPSTQSVSLPKDSIKNNEVVLPNQESRDDSEKSYINQNSNH